jgi:hypothetical protein
MKEDAPFVLGQRQGEVAAKPEVQTSGDVDKVALPVDLQAVVGVAELGDWLRRILLISRSLLIIRTMVKEAQEIDELCRRRWLYVQLTPLVE